MKKFYPYLIDGLIFSLIFLLLCLAYSVTPFGKQSLLTIDLGQQYVDFFALLKDSLLHNPSQFVYSFQKGFGGETIGLWTYYLLSPFNLIFIFFKESDFPTAITLLTYLKLLAASLSFLYFSRQKFLIADWTHLCFALAYAYMSYNLVYMLNIMWLDGLIFLPIIAWGLEQLINQQDNKLYYLSLTLMLMINYYIGFMICLFLILYALYLTGGQNGPQSVQKKILSLGRFAWISLLAAGSASIVLIPTLGSILQSKGQHIRPVIDWQVQHGLNETLSKLFMGAFNFDEIKTGAPNLFSGSLTILGLSLFFSQPKISWRKKLLALGVLAIYLASFMLDPLNLIWHGGQFPIWYTYRFAFTLTFFLMTLSLNGLEEYQRQASKKHLLISAIVYSLFCLYYYVNLADYAYLSPAKILTTYLIFMTFLGLLSVKFTAKSRWVYVFLALSCLEIYGNASLILAEFSYLDSYKFKDYVQVLNQAVQALQSGQHNFYRIDKSFMRTKNEAFFAHYKGMDHFGSTLEAKSSKLYGYLGLADGSGFATYTNSNLFLDDFFAIRYHIINRDDYLKVDHPDEYVIHSEASNADKLAYPLIDQQDRYQIRENSERFGLGMEVSSNIADNLQPFKDHQPAENQEYLLQLLNFDQVVDKFFESVSLPEPTYDNLQVISKGDGDYYTYRKIQQIDPGKIHYSLTFKTADPYYLSLPSQYDNDAISLRFNDQALKYYRPYKTRQLMSLAYHATNQKLPLDINLSKTPYKANLPRLYRLNLANYQKLIDQRQGNLLKIDHFADDSIQGQITIQQKSAYVLFTIPYDQAWQVKVDGQAVEAIPVLNQTLMAIPIQQGKHQISLNYRPKSIIFGIISSIASISIYYLYQYMKRTQKRMS